jgi:hypothetical protein
VTLDRDLSPLLRSVIEGARGLWTADAIDATGQPFRLPPGMDGLRYLS